MDNVRNPEGYWINTELFREEALHFSKNGYYCADPEESPAWYDYWTEQRNRIINGYSVGGVKITGEHYMYLNFCPILKAEDTTKKKTKKVTDFPDFWDGDYNYFWVRQIAKEGIFSATTDEHQKAILELDSMAQAVELKLLFEKLHLEVKIEADYLRGGYNLIVGKSRRKGYSYKAASVGVCNFYTKPNSYTIYGAVDKKYLYPKGIVSMCLNYINFINGNTAFAMPSDYVNKQDHIKASYVEYKNGIKTEKGFKSEIQGLTFGDNPDAARGKDAEDVFFEESGAFGTPGLLKASYAATEDCVKAGDLKTGMITVFGCVCKGTKVWNHKGILTNIENITKETGIIGYASKGTIKENISWLKPPAKKECVRITTDKGESIECSVDHPLLWTKRNYIDYKTNKKLATFKEAKDIKVGDILLQTLQVPQFGNNKMWNPRLVGLMIGDGYYGNKHSSGQLCIAQKELLNYIDSTGIKYVKSKSKKSKNPYFEYITLKGTQEQLRLLGIQGQSKQQKRLPSNIWDYDKNSVSELLGGYFDADGSINKVGRRYKIQLSSVVKELLEEVKVQLYKLGIQSNIYLRKHKKKVLLKSNVTSKTSIISTEKSYSLEICDRESLRNFKKHISFKVIEKQKKLESWDLSRQPTEEILEYQYRHTIEKGNYFINFSKLENLKGRKVKSVEFIGMQDVYNLTADYTHTYITNGFISHNTSGDMTGGTADYAEMFNNPKAFGFLPFQNIWEENKSNMSVGFFHPINWNMEGFYDRHGNSDKEAAKQVELNERKRLIDNGATSSSLMQRKQERPLNPTEAFSYTSNNIFPVEKLNERLQKVINGSLNVKKGLPISFTFTDGKVSVKPIFSDKVEPIHSINNLPKNLKGCPIIYEMPVANPPKGLYKIGYDPIRQDIGTSLAGIIVYKSVYYGDSEHSIIVAEYVGRYDDPEDIDKVAEAFADLYNTQIMYENEITAVKNYFRRIKRLNLLALQPDAVISKNVKKSKVARVYGCHMTDGLKDAGERYIKTWLETVLDFDEDGNPITVIDKIYSRRLLEELINYNRKGNFDLVSALIMCMFQVQEEVLDKEYGKEKENDNIKDLIKMMDDMYKK